MRKRITLVSAMALCLFAALFLISGNPLSAEFKFREFNSDREKFERYSDKAEKSITEQDWQDILDTGKQEMLTEWERNADYEMERYIREGFNETEVRISMEEARADWESSYEKAEAGALGSWYIKREKLVFDDVDFSVLKKSVADAGKDASVKDVPAWDSYVSSSLDDVNSQWDIKFISPLSDLKARGNLLTGDARAGFDAELAAFENELRIKFEVERNSILYSGRNMFITELYVDTASLRYQSDKESADAATDNMIKDIQGDLKTEEDKILAKSYNSEGQAVVDFSGMGDNWEDELKQLVNTGMEKWNTALEKLYREMLDWKQSAEDAYNTAEAIWRKSAEKLEKARLEWETKLSREIYEAFDRWETEETELSANIERSRQDFKGYMENLSAQWNDHSSGLIDLAVNGSKVYTEALDNIKWLEKMCVDNENSITGAFGKKGSVENENENFKTILEPDEAANIQNTITSILNSAGKETIPQRYSRKVCSSYNDEGYCKGYKNVPLTYELHSTGNMSYKSCSGGGEDGYTCNENSRNEYFGHYFYSGGTYKYEYQGAVEKQDEAGNWYLTETYKVSVIGFKMTYDAHDITDNNRFGIGRSSSANYDWYKSNVTLKSFIITNDLKYDSPDIQKSSYYYYKTELERWKKIKESFSGIARDAEYYMHEKNMLGEDNGPGYLDNNGGSDPYLMTGAEFSLELASRDRDFWQKRLDIAKAVLDYANAIKKENAADTESNKADAREKMDTAKALYEKNLIDVKSIVDNLKVLQGQKPLEERNALNGAGWDAYLKSIEYLTQKYSEANKLLQAAEEDYTARKRALILVENGENGDFVLKEIQEIEKNILQADRELYLKQIDFYKKQMDSEYSERTAGFAVNYEAAVKSLEESKLKFNNLKAILSGEENDASLVIWCNSIIAGKNQIWAEDADAYANVLQNLVNDFNASPGDEKILKKERLSSFIKNIYFDLTGKVDSNILIETKLHDGSFDPDSFIKNGFAEDHAVYKKYAETSVKALQIVKNAFDHAVSADNKSYSSIIEWLKTELGNEKFIYGTDNSSYIEHYTALNYFADNYHGLTAEAWESSRDRLDRDVSFSEKAAELHDDFNTMSSEDLAALISENEAKASLGDMESVALLREYYLSGSGISGLEYIDELDRTAEIKNNSYEILKNYISENYRYFQKGQNLLTEHSYLDDMLGYINSIVSLAPGAGDNPLSVESFKNLTPENLSIAAGAIGDYIENLESGNNPVPDFLKSAASALSRLKEKLDSGLFIWRYMKNEISSELSGTVDDVYSRKLIESGQTAAIMGFIQDCNDIIVTGQGDDYTLAMNILFNYEKLSEADKAYLAGHGNEKVKGIDAFVKNLYLLRYTVNLNNTAALYELTEASVTPNLFVSASGIAGDEAEKLKKLIKPVYERRIFDRDFADGKIADIEQYISGRIASGEISSEEGDNLKAYAYIREYELRGSGNSLASSDPAFSEYIKYRKFENYIMSLPRDNGESDSAYADRCAASYHTVNGGELREYEDFAESFIDKDLTSYSYLRDDVKIYAASKYYYDDMFSKNRVPDDGIEKFLEERFGPDSLNSIIVDAVTEYSGRLNAVSFFYGSDLDAYAENMDSAVREYFLMYINGVSDAILPGFEYGLYQCNVSNSSVSVELGKLTSELDRYCEGVEDVVKQMDKYCDMAETGLKNAEALVEFYKNGEQEKNWRGNLLALTEGDILVTPVPMDSINNWSDSYHSESGLRENIAYSSTAVERDGKIFSLNGIVDDMNKITSVYTALGQMMKPDFKPDSTFSIASFLEKADAVYTTGDSYAYENGAFSFEISLGEVVSGFELLRDDNDSEMTAIIGDMESISAGISSSKNMLQSKKFSYDLLCGGKEKSVLMSELEDSRVAHEKEKNEVSKLREDLRIAQSGYELANSAYVKKMNEVSNSYSSYKEFEFNFEKAYSVWEYANTPYLKETSAEAGEITYGQTPDGGSTEYTGIPVPDAKENYTRILAKFTEVSADYDKKAEAVKNQDTVEKLNADPEYRKLKEDFKRKSESFIRTAQVDTELKEDLAEYKQQYSISQKIYDNAKDSINFYSVRVSSTDDPVSDDEKEALISLRDKILNHMLKTGNNESSKVVLDKYMTALRNYSSVVSNKKYRAERDRLESYNNWIYNDEIHTLTERISANALYESVFNNLPEVMKNDIIALYESFSTGEASDNLKIILDNFHNSNYWYGEYKDADRKYDSTSKWKVITRKKWKDKRKERKEKFERYDGRYKDGLRSISDTLEEARKARIDLAKKSGAMEEISSVRNLDEIKTYLKQAKYSLTDEDLSHLYDSTVEGYTADNESINLDFLREEVERKDLDGEAIKARVVNGNIVVLDKDGNATSETYSLDDASVKLKLNGKDAAGYSEDLKYEFYDRNYSISSVTGVLKGRAAAIRQDYYAAIMEFANQSAAEGKHDYTIILRELESIYRGLQQYAAGFNLDNPLVKFADDIENLQKGMKSTDIRAIDNREFRQRGFEGYDTITREYVNNGNGESIQGLIMQALMKQSSDLQNQLWTQQREKFEERKTRWNEVTGYIMNRGMKEWRENYSEFKNLWTKWRFEAKKMISEGENWWQVVNSSMKQDMNSWTAETSKASSKEAAQRIYSDLEGRIGKYETDLKNRMPDSVSFNVNTDKIMSQAMKNRPVDSIGVLSQAMLNTDTSAGFTNMLNLGLSGSLFKYNEEQMEEYTSAIGVMKNLQVIDLLNGIIDGFNSQLTDANKNLYDGVDRYIRGNDTFIVAPFKRNKEENRWEIEVCVESNLTGDKFKTKKFSDYNNFVNSTVFLKPIKGLGGTTIDFTQANTYSNIDGSELETYVSLESEWLNRSIEDVFEEGGFFSGHQEDEYGRLGDKFGKYYGDWMAGETLQSAGFYAKPMFPNGPNMMVAAAIAASMTGQVWLAVAITAASTALSVADGTTAWKHAGTQFAVSAAGAAAGAFAGPAGSMLVNMAASGIKYEEGGGIGWSGKQFKSGVKSGLVNYAVQAGLSYAFGPTAGEQATMSGQFLIGAGGAIVSSGLETGGGWNNIGFDNDSWSEHLTAGASAGVTAGLSAGLTSDTGPKGVFGNNMRTDMLGQMVSQGISTAAIKLTGGKGFTKEYRNANKNFNWNSMAPDASKLGTMIGGMAGNYLKESRAKYNQREAEKNFPQLPHQNDPVGTVETMLGALWYGMKTAKDYADELIAGITGFGGEILNDFGLDDEFAAFTGAAGNSYNTAAEYVNSFADITRGMTADLDAGVSEFVDRTGNFVAGDGFNTDEQIEQIKEQQRLEEIRRDQNLKENQKLVDAKYGESYTDAVPETANSKAVQIIKDKLARGEAVSDREINDFFESAEMKSVERAGKENGSALEKELMEAIKNDPKAFEEAMKAKKLDPAKPEDVQAFSRQMQASFCVLFSEYAQMTLNNVNGTAPSIGEFYKDLLNGKSSNGGKLIDVLNQKASTQEIFDSVAGKGNVKVYGYGQDRNGKGFSDGANDTGNYDGYDMMSKLDELKGDKSIKYITVRVNIGGNRYHDMTLRNGKDGFTLYDNSHRGKNLDYNKYSKFLNKNTIKSFYYIR